MSRNARNHGKVALVTGSTAGIGQAIALSLARLRYAVVLSGRRPAAAVEPLRAEVEDLAGAACVYVQGDIALEETRAALVASVRERYSALDVLVNNAGVTTDGRKDVLALAEDEIEGLLKINLVAPLLLTSALAPLMAGHADPAYLINISSISAYTVSTDRADYCVSKAGLAMLTQLFAARLAADNVRVFELRPGIIATDMTAPVKEKYDRLIEDGLLPIRRWGAPGDVARAVEGIVQGYLPYATGEVINIDGGFHIRRL